MDELQATLPAKTRLSPEYTVGFFGFSPGIEELYPYRRSIVSQRVLQNQEVF